MPALSINMLQTMSIVISDNLKKMGFVPDNLTVQEDFSIRQMIVDVILDEIEANKTPVEKAIEQWAQSLSKEDAQTLSDSMERGRKHIEEAILGKGENKDG